MADRKQSTIRAGGSVLPRGNAGPFLWLRNPASSPYIGTMPKPMELPPAVAHRFVEDMCAFHAEPNAIKQDETRCAPAACA
jgi:hypothetical protein